MLLTITMCIHFILVDPRDTANTFNNANRSNLETLSYPKCFIQFYSWPHSQRIWIQGSLKTSYAGVFQVIKFRAAILYNSTKPWIETLMFLTIAKSFTGEEKKPHTTEI
ncbi:hypothetical protein TNCT_73111 [Trichonephila clavata]|uniref:Uncharacterized protein n=1 Tax=Trichonephila clavata TaxID=2740835 RepID=A0A8X6L6F4_TRICU|nr:hypothetical protein TNCT_73111 [Trichonephila clavata]